ncbi:DUF6884 domain-containing protein [Polaribacter sp.]|uniref:DUF6884 domain-containing protein n=1 Tax=Polaribacter sp. TaxID=1920175 RepID=UPI004047F776
MKKIILISCGSKKLDKRAKAKDMYTSPLFKHSLDYAEKLKPDNIFILSAFYGLLDLETEIYPYDVTIANISKENQLKKPHLKVLDKREKTEWGIEIIEKLEKITDIKNDLFIVLAGKEYVEPIKPYLTNIEQPLEGVGLFDRIAHLKKGTKHNKVDELHRLFNEKRRYKFPFEQYEEEIPKNGIYILFENGEKYKEYDRVVRIGSHTGENQLVPRLRQHFLIENKNRSIFRKNIGRCILKKEGSPYVDIWELDTTSRIDKETNFWKLDVDFEKEIEKRISEFIQKNFSFCVIEINGKKQRLDFEKKLISTFGSSKQLIPSENWLGYYSPKEKIIDSGLWQVNNLSGSEFTESEFNWLIKILNK